MKKETKDRAKLAVGGIAIGTALAAPLGENIRKFAHNRIPISDNNLSEENKKLYSKLGRIAKNQKTYLTNGHNQEDYYTSSIPKERIEQAKREIKLAKRNFANYRFERTLQKASSGNPSLKGTSHKLENKSTRNWIKDAKSILNSKDLINIGDKNRNESGAFLAHELGHSMHKNGRGGSKIGKIAHNLRDEVGEFESKLSKGVYKKTGIKLYDTHISNGLGITSGLLSGIKAGRDEKKGKKESVLNKLAPYAVPLAYKSPTLVSEFEASRQGMKLLKQAGASKGYRKAAGKTLGAAFGTYASTLAAPLLAAYGARQVGKVVGRNTVRNNKKKDDNTKD